MLYSSFGWPSAEILDRLIRDARDGRSTAVDELLTLLRPPLLAFFRRKSAVDGAEDLAQMALIRIVRAIGRIDPQRADAYISTVARNLLRTAYKATARDRSREGEVDTNDLPAGSVDEQRRIEYRELALAIHRACVEKLGPGLREVAVGVLRGESTVEIATALHISPVTVRTRLMRVRAVLRHELADYLEAPNA